MLSGEQQSEMGKFFIGKMQEEAEAAMVKILSPALDRMKAFGYEWRVRVRPYMLDDKIFFCRQAESGEFLGRLLVEVFMGNEKDKKGVK